ncbi:MAG: T9SS type A sorting domain-containing protein [Lewinellaceae bacterium]|nr:T9SS type A sorting domain-containing protein [Saprospiraceae bacterium]MCB9336901.1 T9SS type A sorting domain-containing protein [Lewinellaceae bacterium]
MDKTTCRYLAALCVIFCLAINNLQSQVTWDGGGGNNLWSNGLNWDTNTAPTSSDDVVIDAFSVEIPNGYLAFANSVTLNGSTLSLVGTGKLTIDVGGSFALGINGATVTNGGNIQISNCAIGISLQGSSSSLINNGGITINNHSGAGLLFAPGSSGCSVDNNNSMSFDNGTNANVGAISYQASNAFNNDGTITIGSTAHAGMGIAFGVFGGTFTNTGTINIVNTGAAKVGFSSGFFPGILTNTGTGIINIGSGVGGNWIGGFNLDLTNNGTINLDKSGAVDVILSGSGTFAGALEFSTTNKVAPGNSAGCLAFNSGYSNSGNTAVEIGGTTACSQQDKINVTGTANLGGSLTITLIGGYMPPTGQLTQFTILNANAINGTYASVSYPTVPDITWTISYTATEVMVNANGILPVELTYFSAKSTDNQSVRLDWHTASEANNEGFSIERSDDAKDWDEIAFVNGHGTTVAAHSYYFLDEKPLAGMNYYRLRQMDFDGKEELSGVVSIDIQNLEDFGNLVFPNPTNGTFEVQGNFPPEALLRISDSFGRLVKEQTLSQTSFVDISSEPSGIYCMSISFFNRLVSKRLVKR